LKQVRLAPIVCLLWCLAAPSADANPAAAEAARVTNVLVLHHYGQEVPFRGAFDAAIQDALRTASSGPIDVYIETLDAFRFPAAAESGLVRNYLKAKYAEKKIDVAITVTDLAAEFAWRNRDIFKAPIVAYVTDRKLETGKEDVTGLRGSLALGDTLDLALRLLPSTEHVFVVDGAVDNTSAAEAELRRLVGALDRPLELVYLRDLPMAELIERLNAVPDRSVVYFVRQTMLDRTTTMDVREGFEEVLRASPAPVFTATSELIGMGAVGVYRWQIGADAARLADMAIRIANGEKARDIPPGLATLAPTVDWRQLRRWNIPESRLPAGSLVLFRPQSFFELYRRYVVAGLLIFGVQLALIVGLLVQRVRRRKAERESRNSEARYRSVVDTQTEMICRYLPDSTLTFVNDAYCRFWNRKREDLLGKKFVEFVPASWRDVVLDHLGRISSGVATHEHPVVLQDTTIGWHHWINHAIVDDQGRVVELQGMGRDITDQKRAEEAVGQLEARNSAILRAIPDLMFMLLRDGTYVDYHARETDLLFMSPDQFLGRTIREILPPPVCDILTDALGRACDSDEPVVVEYELPIDGVPRHFEARLVYAGHDRVLSIVRDVTESRRTLDLNRDLAGRLIASQEAERTRIARDLHDGVCQDVAAIGVDVSHLRKQGGEIQSAEAQEILLSVERRAADVAEALRLLSHGLHPSVLQHIGLVAALQAHCAEVERQHNVQVKFFADEDVEPASRAVALSLFRITQEALRNAARHGHARHATVSLARTARELSLTVTDDGRGFDAAAARRNDGIGLVSIEERARQVQGQATIRSQPGNGTTITVRVPAHVADSAHGREVESRHGTSRRPAFGRR
jgi:PAS domain S-box-containing protein